MHPALLLLLRLRRRAFWRRTIAGLKTPRGAALAAATAMFFALMVLPQFILPIIAAFSPAGAEANRQFVQSTMPVIRTLLPLTLLTLVLVSVGTGWGESAIYFTPADLDILFPGPFSRRDLLLYKLRQSIRSSLFAGTFFGIFATARRRLARFRAHTPVHQRFHADADACEPDCIAPRRHALAAYRLVGRRHHHRFGPHLND